MNEIEFLDKFRSDKEMLLAYGNFTFDLIAKEIENKLQIELKYFFKVPVTVRLKDEEAIIQKAFYRNKNYKDPYLDITDKIGGRIVVLLEDQANGVCQVVEGLKGYLVSKDRDFEKEREANPELFSYQSHHYILRNTEELNLNGFIVKSNTPVEVQIRTLLQHAYSELTHEAIYKPNIAATPEIRRIVAKSMALIEMTDQLFTQVNKTLNHSNILFDKTISELGKLYPTTIKLKNAKSINNLILDAYIEEVQMLSMEALRKFSKEYSFIFEKIDHRQKNKHLYEQAALLFVYWLSTRKRKLVKMRWPFNPSDLEDIFVDLGISYDKS